MSTWPKASPWGDVWPEVNLTKVVTHLTTRCLSWRVNPTKGQSDLQTWQNVNLTWSLNYGGVHLTKCRKVIWKSEHTLRFRSCFTEVFSTKDQKICLARNYMKYQITSNIQICKENSSLPTPLIPGGWGQFNKKLFLLKLHEMSRTTKTWPPHFANTSPPRDWGQFTNKFHARNCMKYPDLQRKLIFANSGTSSGSSSRGLREAYGSWRSYI